VEQRLQLAGALDVTARAASINRERQFRTKTCDPGDGSVPPGAQPVEQESIVADQQCPITAGARLRVGGKMLGNAAAVFNSDDELFVVEKSDHRRRLETIGKVGQVVEKDRTGKGLTHRACKRLEVLLLLSEEHRHRQQHGTTTGLARALT